MIGAMEKGIQAARIAAPPMGVCEGVDLRTIPKFVSFKAAMLHNKLTQQFTILVLSFLLCAQYLINRHETLSLYEKLRTKEYILAPGVQDFTPASSGTVSDEYVADAVNDFLSLIGNVGSGNIEEQYKSVSDLMSPSLKARFLTESQEWITKVKSESISELFTVTDKEIVSHDDGTFQTTIFGKRDRYINNEYAGRADEVIELTLELIPPKKEKRWYLQIDNLTRSSLANYKTKKKL
jgi:hypothetical protein